MIENEILIKKHLDHLKMSPHNASVQYFLEKGTINGGFLLALIELVEEAKRAGVIEYKLYLESKE